MAHAPHPVESFAGALLEALGERIDTESLARVYVTASVPTAQVKAELRIRGVAWHDPDGPGCVVEQVAVTSERFVHEASTRAAFLGAASTLAGALALAPETAGMVVATLRLAQRLAVIHGFDPETDAGRMVMLRALAAGWGIEVPAQLNLQLRARDLPALVRARFAPAIADDLGARARSAVARGLARRALRAVPGLGAGMAGWSTRRKMLTAGARMRAVFERACEATPFDLPDERPTTLVTR
jgi:hypothetical protein